MITGIRMRTIFVAWALLSGLAQTPELQSGSGPAEVAPLARPYHFTRSETDHFLDIHRRWPDVHHYLNDPSSTPWGIIVGDYGRDFLLFEDVRGSIHVIEVTGQPVAQAVRKVPFESSRFETIGL